MSKLFTLLVALIFMGHSALGQIWVDIGPKANFGLTGFYHSDLWDNSEHKVLFKTGFSYGGKFGLYLGENFGFVFEGLIGNSSQEFERTVGNSRQINSTKWQTLDLAIMPRLNFTGSYIELGPQFSRLRNFEQTYNGLPLDTEQFYNTNYVNAVFGFGGFIAGSEFFTLSMGVRFGWAVTNFLMEDISAAGAPPAPYMNFDTVNPVNPFYASFVAELTFGIGGVAKAECGRRAFLIGSRYR
jgi:hypothetical protein